MYSTKLIMAETATDAWESCFRVIMSEGETVESRIGTTKHLTNVMVVMNHPERGVCLSPVRNMSLRYMLGELQWYMSGSNKVSDIAKFGKMWKDLSDDGETVNSAYGYRIFHQFGFDQLQHCIDKLKKNPYDRQAVIHIKTPSNIPTKDTPCTCHIQFTCFEGKLNAHVYMRSNDLWFGMPYDMAFFTTLQQIVAQKTGLPLGEYVHTVGDMHIYEKHWSKYNDLLWQESAVEKFREERFAPWSWTKETPENIQRMIDGEVPENLTLRYLKELNNG